MSAEFAIGLLRRFWSYAALTLALLAAWHFQSRAIANADALRTQAGQFKQAQADATRLAAEALHHQAAVYTARAQEAQRTHDTQLASARAAADRYIASHRVQQPAAAQSAAGNAAQAGADRDPAVSASVPAGAVLVTADDVHACTDAVTYARAAHDWAAGLNKEGD